MWSQIEEVEIRTSHIDVHHNVSLTLPPVNWWLENVGRPLLAFDVKFFGGVPSFWIPIWDSHHLSSWNVSPRHVLGVNPQLLRHGSSRGAMVTGAHPNFFTSQGWQAWLANRTALKVSDFFATFFYGAEFFLLREMWISRVVVVLELV